MRKKKHKPKIKFATLFIKINFLLYLKVMCTKRIKKEIKETAAQLALALTKKLSTNTMTNIGREKIRRNLVLKSLMKFFPNPKIKKKKIRGPTIIIWLPTNFRLSTKCKPDLSRAALSAVCSKVTQLLLIFQMIFGAIITTKVRIKQRKNNLFLKKIFLISFSNNKNTIEIIK